MNAINVHTVNMSTWVPIFLICYSGDLVKLFGFTVCQMENEQKEEEEGWTTRDGNVQLLNNRLQ